MTVTAILTAGGTGSRMKRNLPKQFVTVNDIPVIIYTLQRFQKNKIVENVIVACLKEWQPVLRAYGKEFNITNLKHIVNGGSTGVESIKNAFNAIEDAKDDDIVLIHDGNRPLVDDDIIENNITSAKKTGVTTTYTDIHDGVIKVDKSLKIQKSDITRDDIKSTQTPHCFKYKTLKKIFSEIDDVDFSKYISLADMASRLNYEVALVKGSDLNFKITTPDELALFEAIINSKYGNVQ